MDGGDLSPKNPIPAHHRRFHIIVIFSYSRNIPLASSISHLINTLLVLFAFQHHLQQQRFPSDHRILPPPAAMSGIVVIFDFDKTIIDIDSDNWVVDELGATDLFNQLLPTMPWNSLMDRMMEELHLQGTTMADIEQVLNRVPIHPRIVPAVKAAYALGCDLRVVSDANVFYIETILKHLGIRECFSEINTNPGFGKVIERIQASLEGNKRIVYLGDGAGDFCPSLKLLEGDYMMPRKDFPVWELICKTRHMVKADVREWTDGEDLERVLLTIIAMEDTKNNVDNTNQLFDCKFETIALEALPKPLYTIIDIDSDNWVVDELGATDLFNQLLATMPWNSSVENIEEVLKRIPIHPRVVPTIKAVHALGCDLRVLSDANLFYIETILKHLGIRDCFSEINTNPGFVNEEGTLRIEPFHDFHTFSHERIQATLEEEGKKTIIYLGDGAGDFCPSLKLVETDYMMPRKDFPVWDLICKNRHLLKAEVHEWTDGEDLERVLLQLITTVVSMEDMKNNIDNENQLFDCKFEKIAHETLSKPLYVP
ncbi:HAD-like domain-containing protein [Cynara cardunculus var. scolymus]|uniref:HAD-like domain-containing protein n=1 Tax=Cynara cardunculus var. scolymus TaxID=59895 RepID=A0A103YB84_CYNCS|nr:HAD-like domain-containing protein [Cynara cardunculus var. scolymus]